MEEKKTYAPVLRTQADVEAAWRHLVRPLGWPEPRLWFMFIGADSVPFPRIGEIAEVPVEMPPEQCAGVVDMLRRLVEDLGFDRVALLLCRPGGGRPTEIDKANASVLYAACRDARLTVEVIHLATDEAFWPIPYDSAAPAAIAV